MKKKRIKYPRTLVYTIILIIPLIVILVFATFYSPKYDLQTQETTTTSIITTSTISPTTTSVPTAQICSNFKWKIDGTRYFDLRGDYRILVVDFTAQYIGDKEEDYSWTGAYKFKLLDNKERYYNPQESYIYCDYSNRFRFPTLIPGHITGGCMEFSVLDINEPTKLVFYDYIVNTVCEISLS